MRKVLTCILIIFCFNAFADSSPVTVPPPATRENIVIKPHTITIGNTQYSYESHTGTFLLNDEKEKNAASMFFTAYFLDNPDHHPRPLIFCFNGGPGCATIWLHMGSFAPKKVLIDDVSALQSPGIYDVNPCTLLPQADLVFIDAMSTGFSRPAENVPPEQFYSVKEDAALFAEFVRYFTTHYKRWNSPIFLLGESYGTVRAVITADTLSSTYDLPVNGLILISSALNMETLGVDKNDFSLPLALPSLAACSWYHKKLSPELQAKPLQDLLDEVEEFASKEYADALLLGNTIDPEYKKQIATTVARYTGLDPEYVYQSNNRIYICRFFKELLRNEGKVVGRFDCRYSAFDSDPVADFPSTDPSYDNIRNAFTTAYQVYLERELGWEKNEPYYVCNYKTRPWKPLEEDNHFEDRYLNVLPTLQQLMLTNPHLRIFVASGIYDLAVPYFASEYMYRHVLLPAPIFKNIVRNYYEAGHMMYTSEEAQKLLHNDLVEFIK